jgi:hypothetical protein
MSYASGTDLFRRAAQVRFGFTSDSDRKADMAEKSA